MQKIAILTVILSFTGMISCNKMSDDIDELSVHQDQNTTENVVPMSSSSYTIDHTPGPAWSLAYSSGSKIRVFQHGSISNRTYVMAVDLQAGGQVIPYYEFASGNGNATYAKPSPSFQLKRVNDFNMASLGWFAVANFGFFGYTNQSSFLLRKNGTLVTAGFGTFSSSESQRRTITIAGSSATVYSGPGNNSGNYYTLANSLYTGATHAMTGLHPSPTIAPKTPNGSIGRTFVGVRQKTPGTNGGPAFVYVLTGEKLTQQQAYDMLIGFGCNSSEIVMFDGSGSTQLNVGGSVLVPSSDNRYVPTFLVIK